MSIKPVPIHCCLIRIEAVKLVSGRIVLVRLVSMKVVNIPIASIVRLVAIKASD